MMRAATCAATLLLATGCLGDLVKPPGQDGGTSGGDGGAGGDAAADPDAGGTVDFPGDLAIRITTLVVDLNANGFPDLVLLNDPPTADDRGVLIFFDRAEGFFGQPDQFLPTEFSPLVATTGDFVGGAPLDLMVVANDPSDDTPYLIVFENTGESRFTNVVERGFPGQTLTAGTVDEPTPVFATTTFIRASADAPPGVVFGDSDLALYVSIQDWADLSAADDRVLDVADSTTMNVALSIPSASDDRNDLLVLDNQGGYWVENSGAVEGGYQAGPSAIPGLWADNNRAFFVFDLQGDGLPDVMTLDQMVLDVGVFGWDEEEPSVDVREIDPAPSFGDSFGDALFAADIDGIAGMDLLVLDEVEENSQFGLHVARNIEPAGAGIFSPASGRFDADATHAGHPTRLVVGDFDHDGEPEEWVFDASLSLKMCLVGEIYDVDHYRFNECD